MNGCESNATMLDGCANTPMRDEAIPSSRRGDPMMMDGCADTPMRDDAIPLGPSDAQCSAPQAHLPAAECEQAQANTPGNPAAPPASETGTSFGGSVFDVGNGYTIRKLIGQGAFGCVVAADRSDGDKVAIKKVANTGSDKTAAKRLLRELRFLRHLRGHPNVVSIEDVIVTRNHESRLDVYIVTELMEADLEQIIKSSQALSNEHVRCLIFQLLNGLRHMHRAGIVHRDLKPANLIVDSNCRLKICDLGLSRHIADSLAVPEGEDARFTDYVVTRWYRAPELLMGSSRYSEKVDTWAAGCILGELMARRPIFSGDNTSDMLVKITGRIGAPSADDVTSLTEQERARRFVLSIAPGACRSLTDLLPTAEPAGLVLLRHLLQWTPGRRASVEDALQSSFLRDLDEAPRALPTDQEELAAISSGNLHPWLVLDLICLEGCIWRSDDRHFRVSASPALASMPHSAQCKAGQSPNTQPQPVQCACGHSFGSSFQFLAHLHAGSCSMDC